MYVYGHHRIIQIHFNKTGGTSLRSYLESALGEEAHVLHGKHNILSDARAYVGEGYRLVTTIRNPYDRLVSLQAHRRNRYARGERGYAEQRLKAADNLSFEDWVTQDLLPHSAAGGPMDQPLSAVLGDAGEFDGVLAVLKLEELEMAAPSFVRDLGISAPTLSQHLNASPRHHWREYYDDQLLLTVYHWDRPVFDRFYPELAPPGIAR